MRQFLAKIEKLEAWHIACVIYALGFIVFFTGLNGGFQGDDNFQIIQNIPVHSFKNLFMFFSGGTFYNGFQLTGDYYRPMMSTTFSAIYTLFGPHPIAFHIVQLLLYLTGAFVLYLIFRHFFKPLLALALILIFVVHPLNSQDVFAIPSMQDALFFLFGTLALWTLITYKSTQSMVAAAAWLFLALLSKEAAMIFVVISFLYLFLWDRERLSRFAGIMLLPFAVYLALKANAVGLVGRHPKGGPIDNFSLLARMFTVPSLILFYASKFVFPSQLANNFYWVYSSFSVRHVLLPLLADLAIIALFVYFGIRIRHKLPKEQFKRYLFFMAWAALGLGIYLQFIPLDMTACEGWVYLSMAGLIGAIGIIVQTVRFRLHPGIPLVLVVLLVCVLGARSAVRGTDFHDQLTLGLHDVKVSKEDYFAMNNLSQKLIDKGDFRQAAYYAKQSVAIYPAVGNYDNLGVALEQSRDYAGAAKAYSAALKYGDMNIVYENLSLILMMYSDPASASQFFQKAIKAYPQDFRLRLYLALFEGAENQTDAAKADIQTAAKYGAVPPIIYNNIMTNQPFSIPLLGKTLLIR
jgi:tetratricopeptide (TPR) repeat protein